MPIHECELIESDVLEADEVWLTSTGLEVSPVGSVNGHTIGNGEAGVTWHAIDQIFQNKKAEFRSAV